MRAKQQSGPTEAVANTSCERAETTSEDIAIHDTVSDYLSTNTDHHDMDHLLDINKPDDVWDTPPIEDPQPGLHFYDDERATFASQFCATDDQQQDLRGYNINGPASFTQQHLHLSNDCSMHTPHKTPQLSPSSSLYSHIPNSDFHSMHTENQQQAQRQQPVGHQFCSSQMPMNPQVNSVYRQFPSQSVCSCSITSETPSSHFQHGRFGLPQQQMYDYYHRGAHPCSPPWAGHPGHYTYMSCGQIDTSCGVSSPSGSSSSSFGFPPLPRSPYITLPAPIPSERGHYCHHGAY